MIKELVEFVVALMVALTAAPMTDEAPPRIVLTEPTAVVVETEAVAETTAAENRTGFTAYRVHGITPPIEWQQLLYTELKRNGIEWYMPCAVCQVFQESRWNQYADNGHDRGITQQKEIYWSGRAARYGATGASIWDVNAQFKVFAGMMSGYLKATNSDIGLALSYYFYGNGEYAEKYVADVMSHLGFMFGVRKSGLQFLRLQAERLEVLPVLWGVLGGVTE